jgi:hypothetical protein
MTALVKARMRALAIIVECISLGGQLAFAGLLMSAASNYFQLESLVSEAVKLKQQLDLRGRRGATNKVMGLMAHHPAHWLSSDPTVLARIEERASEAVRGHYLYGAVTSPYPIEALTKYADTALHPSDRELRLMMVFHGERKALLTDRRAVFSLRSQATWLFAAAAVVSRTLPKEVVRRLGWNYSNYLWYSFRFFVIALGLILVWKWLVRVAYARRNEIISVTGTVQAAMTASREDPSHEGRRDPFPEGVEGEGIPPPK